MKKIFKFSFLGLFLFFASCDNIYRDFQTVEDMKWFRKDVKTFKFDIAEDAHYDLLFAFRHATGYPFTSIKIHIEQISPDKKVYEKDAEFPVADKNGAYIGEVTGQLWDIERVFSEKTFLKKGTYTLKISHAMNSNPVILVIDIGLIVKKHSNKQSL